MVHVSFYQEIDRLVDEQLETSERKTFNLEDTVSESEEGNADNNTETSAFPEELDDDDLDSLPPDQDHSHLTRNPTSDIDSMSKARIFSLETEIQTLKNTLLGKESDLRTQQSEIIDLQDRNLSVLKESKEKDEELEKLKATIISLKEASNVQEKRVMRYGEMILSLKASGEKGGGNSRVQKVLKIKMRN